MIKKRIILISVLAALFVLMLIGYFVFVDPLLHETEEKEKIELLDGEVLGSASSILMFDQVERENIQSIEVQNSYGGYTFFYDKDKKDFFIKDYLDAPYSKEMFATLITATGFPTTMRRVTTKTENFSEYGLDEKDNPASYVLKTRDGITHKVYIGKMIPTGAGFYARYDGRDTVYIVESSISQTVLSPVTNLISAMLFLPTTQSNYFAVKDFIIAKDGKTLVFYEVKSRTPASVFKYGSGRYALDARKKAAFISAVKMYLYKNAIQSPVRIDVIEISFKGDTFFEYDLKHFKKAFGEQSTPYTYRKF